MFPWAFLALIGYVFRTPKSECCHQAILDAIAQVGSGGGGLKRRLMICHVAGKWRHVGEQHTHINYQQHSEETFWCQFPGKMADVQWSTVYIPSCCCPLMRERRRKLQSLVIACLSLPTRSTYNLVSPTGRSVLYNERSSTCMLGLPPSLTSLLYK